MRYTLLLVLMWAGMAGATDIPLTVTEQTGLARTGEPVASGIPFGVSDGVYSTSGFGVFDGTTEIPAQFTVTSRWYGAPADGTKAVRWVLVEFQPSCGASSSKTYTLKTSGGSGTTATGMAVTDSSGSIIVNTGEAEFTLNKTSWSIFDKVLIKNPLDSNNLTRTVVSTGASSGASLTRTSNGTAYYAKNNVITSVVESQGPLHSVVLLTGKFKDAATTNLFDWKARVHFYQGKSYAKVDFSFIDKETNALITDSIALNSVLMQLKLATSGDTTYSLAGDGSTTHTGTLTGTQAASLLQTGTIDQDGSTADDGASGTIIYSLGGQASGSGVHARGWADLSDSTKGVTVAVKYFWQLYPKKLEVVNDGTLNVYLWPTGVANMNMYAAAQKTHEVLYYFHNGTAAGAGSDALVNGLFGVDTSYTSGSALSRHHNLLPVAPASRYSGSKALGYVGTRDTSAYPSDVQALVTKYYGYVDGLLDRSLRERDSAGSRGGGHEYMMWNFGDSRDDAWSNMPYDTLRADALQFAASGDRKFIDHLEEAAQQFRDVDVEHSIVNTRPALTGATYPFLGRTRYNPNSGLHDMGQVSRNNYGFEHYKGQGLADHYFLTGDALSKDVLIESYNYYSTWKSTEGYWNGYNVRAASKTLGPILGYYQATGDPAAVTEANHVISYLNTWQRTVTPNDPNGWMWEGQYNDTPYTQSSAQTGLTQNFMLHYMLDIPSPINITQNVVDSCKYIVAPGNNLWTGSYFNDWPSYNYGVAHATASDFMANGGLSFCSIKTGDLSYATVAKTALNNGIDLSSETGSLKPYTQKARYTPTMLYFLQSVPYFPTPSLVGKLSGTIR